MSQQQKEEYRLRDQEMIAMRVGGMSYADIAKRYGIVQANVRRVLKRALKRGQVTAEQMRLSPTFGKAPRPPMAKEEYNTRWVMRIMLRVSINEHGCWLWTGPKSEKGYGMTAYRAKSTTVHRAIYKIMKDAALTKDQFVCHRCDVPACCNPDHLFLGDNDINMADKCAKGRHHEMKVTHCPRGHAYEGENLRINPNGSRACKTCQTARGRLKAGWPEDLAYSSVKVLPGYSLVGGNWKNARKKNQIDAALERKPT